eukprot:10018484-Alexandrium_andersonii.AAC.1
MDLHTALGALAREAWAPLASSPARATARSALARALRLRECRRRARSPFILWRLLRAEAPPGRFTWGQPVADATVPQMFRLLNSGGREIARPVASLNVR